MRGSDRWSCDGSRCESHSRGAVRASAFPRLLAGAMLYASFVGISFAQVDFSDMPFLHDDAKSRLTERYNGERTSKALAVAVGGAWAYVARRKTIEEARETARANCEKNSRGQTCFIYAENEEVVSIEPNDQLRALLVPSHTFSGKWLTTNGVPHGVELKIEHVRLNRVKATLTLTSPGSTWGGCL